MKARFLDAVSSENQLYAGELIDGLIEAQGRTRSIAYAYILGQRSEKGAEQQLSEGEMLSALMDANGVPTIKLKQFLAFGNKMGAFQEAFERSQNAALPISYLEAVRLVEKRFKGKWPEGSRIKGILGTGSVNIAIEFHDGATGEDRVLSLAREDIETATANDFRRFKRMIGHLTSTPAGMKRYGFLIGLVDLVEDAVRQEFDKEAAFFMLASWEKLYEQKMGAWNVKTVRAFEGSNATMHFTMEKASGKSAVDVRKENPSLYKSAMEALLSIEFDILMGIDTSRGGWFRAFPSALHANPDFHDGQVMIDGKSMTVTLLDPGQAVKITNKQRDFALDLLRVVIKEGETIDSSLDLINHSILATGKKAAKPLIEREELIAILANGNRMDSFLDLVSLLNRKGHKVPLPVVNWVFAIQRLTILGEKIGRPIEPQLKNLIVTRKLTGSQFLYNIGHTASRKANGTGVSASRP
jgi:hypothetical protein